MARGVFSQFSDLSLKNQIFHEHSHSLKKVREMKISRIKQELETFNRIDRNHGNDEEHIFLENKFVELIDFSAEVYSESKLFHLLNSDPATSIHNKIKKEIVDVSEDVLSEEVLVQLLNSDLTTPDECYQEDKKGFYLDSSIFYTKKTA